MERGSGNLSRSFLRLSGGSSRFLATLLGPSARTIHFRGSCHRRCLSATCNLERVKWVSRGTRKFTLVDGRLCFFIENRWYEISQCAVIAYLGQTTSALGQIFKKSRCYRFHLWNFLPRTNLLSYLSSWKDATLHVPCSLNTVFINCNMSIRPRALRDPHDRVGPYRVRETI